MNSVWLNKIPAVMNPPKSVIDSIVMQASFNKTAALSTAIQPPKQIMDAFALQASLKRTLTSKSILKATLLGGLADHYKKKSGFSFGFDFEGFQQKRTTLSSIGYDPWQWHNSANQSKMGFAINSKPYWAGSCGMFHDVSSAFDSVFRDTSSEASPITLLETSFINRFDLFHEIHNQKQSSPPNCLSALIAITGRSIEELWEFILDDPELKSLLANAFIKYNAAVRKEYFDKFHSLNFCYCFVPDQRKRHEYLDLITTVKEDSGLDENLILNQEAKQSFSNSPHGTFKLNQSLRAA